MKLRAVYEPLRFDWRHFFDEISTETADGFPAAALSMSATSAAHLFSICISDEELVEVRRWIRESGSAAREAVYNLLERAPRVRSSTLDLDDAVYMKQFPDPTPSVVVTTNHRKETLPPSVGSTVIESGLMFSGSPTVLQAHTFRTQPFQFTDNPRLELWEKIIKPFGRADEILLCDPYAIEKAARIKDPSKSGLAFYVNRFRELAEHEGRSMTLHVMSTHGGPNMSILTQDRLDELKEALTGGAASRLTLRLSVVAFNTQGYDVTLHARYLIARQASVETRVLVFDSSVVPDSRVNAPSPERVQQVSLYYVPDHIRVYTDDWLRARRYEEFSA